MARRERKSGDRTPDEVPIIEDSTGSGRPPGRGEWAAARARPPRRLPSGHTPRPALLLLADVFSH